MSNTNIRKEYISPATTIVSLDNSALMQEIEYTGSDVQTNSSFDSGTVLVASGDITITSGWSEEKSETGSQMGKDDEQTGYDADAWLLEW